MTKGGKWDGMNDGGASWDKRRNILHPDMTADSEVAPLLLRAPSSSSSTTLTRHSCPFPPPHPLPPAGVVGGMSFSDGAATSRPTQAGNLLDTAHSS